MNWYWIFLIVAGALLVFFLAAGYAFFLYVCNPKRDSSASLNGEGGRSLEAYIPLIQQKALERARFSHKAVSIRAFDGILLRANLYPNRYSDRFVILVHGYHSSAAWDFASSFEMYYRAGYSILALENRGHGSEGRYIGYGALDQKDVRSWMDWLVAGNGEAIRIALAGVSMGAATVMMAGSNYAIPQLKCVIEDCGYSNLVELVHYLVHNRKVPAFLLTAFASLWCKLLAGYFFSDAIPERDLKKCSTPMLFIHGTADTLVPYRMHKRVYEACAAPKEIAIFEGSIHGESSFREPERYEKLAVGFLEKYMNG